MMMSIILFLLLFFLKWGGTDVGGFSLTGSVEIMCDNPSNYIQILILNEVKTEQ
jgi:hypothetical protein